MSVALRYLLDTNIISDVINRGRTSPVSRKIDVVGASVCTSIIVAAEIRYGVAKKGSDLLAQRAAAVLATIPLCAFTAPLDEHYAEIRVFLERRGTPIGPNDLMIAAQCRALGLCLVTANVDEFARVQGLTIENWLSSADVPPPNA